MLKSAKRIVDRYINKAKRERDKEGYRENLGYDSQNDIQDEIDNTLNLSYSENANIIDYFYKQCETI